MTENHQTVYCCNGEIPADYEVKELNEGPKTEDNNIKVTSIDIYSVKVKLSIQIISILFKSEILGTIYNRVGQKSIIFLVGILWETITSCIHSEFNWPLPGSWIGKNVSIMEENIFSESILIFWKLRTIFTYVMHYYKTNS